MGKYEIFKELFEYCDNLKKIQIQMDSLFEELERLKVENLSKEALNVRLELLKKELLMRLKDSYILQSKIQKIAQNAKRN
ncbi:MAG: hypothetical protein QXD62_03715 [Candidatus Woesearchaeota archaeon]